MKNKIAKVIAIISIIMCICIFGNTSSAIDVYNYNGINIISDVYSGYTIRRALSDYLGTVDNLKSFGIDVGEDASQALIERIYIRFESADNEQMQPDTLIKTGDKFFDKQGKQYTFALKGDVNCDGKLGVADVLLVKKYLLGVPFKVNFFGESVEISSTEQDKNTDELELFKKIADFNNDGEVKTADLITLKQSLLRDGIEDIDGDLNFDGICDVLDYKIMLDIREGKYKLDVFQKNASEYFNNMSTEEIKNYVDKIYNSINN